MERFIPISLSSRNGYCQFDNEHGVQFVINGDESRRELVWRIIDHEEEISARAIRLLELFMRERGTFELSSIEVFASVTPKEGDFALRYTFTTEHDPAEYGYTYFDVFFICHEPPQEPFWPFKFTVGFH